MTTSDGMYIGRTRFAAGDRTGPDSTRTVLRNPAIDTAVLEIAPDGILNDGLGVDRCDVAVVMNVSTDPLNSEKAHAVEDCSRVMTVITRAVSPDGASVLNADDEGTARLVETAHGEIFYFSRDEQNPVIGDHLLKGGKAVVLRQTLAGEMVTLLAGEGETALLLATELSSTHDGFMQVNIASVLAATAAAIAQNVPLETIRTSLRSSFVTCDVLGTRAGNRADDETGE